MITELQFRALLRYEAAALPIPADGLSDVDQWLADHGLIKVLDIAVSSGTGLYSETSATLGITPAGRLELAEYRHQRRWRILSAAAQVGLIVLAAFLTALFTRLLQ